MRIFRSLLILSPFLLVTAIPSIASDVATMGMVQTQLEMNERACGAFRKADDEMNTVYKKILNKNRSDKLFVQKMRAAQRAWLLFRDAHLDSMFPATDKRSEYGTAYPMCRCMELEKITDERTRVLQQWIDGVEEGDVCSGSIRAK